MTDLIPKDAAKAPGTPQAGTAVDVSSLLTRLNYAVGALGAPANVGSERPLEVLQVIAGGAAQLTPGGVAAVCASSDGGELDFRHTHLKPGDIETTLVALAGSRDSLKGDDPCPAALGRRAIELRRPMLSYEGGGMAAASSPSDAAVGGRSAAAFPLLAADTALGVLYVHLIEPRPFDEIELLALENFAIQAAAAIARSRESARYQRNLARKEDEMARLRHAGLLISSRLQLEETLEAILQMAMEVTDAHYGIFRLVEGDSLVARAMVGERRGRPAIEPLPLNTTSVMGWVARKQQPLRIPDLRAEPWSRIYYPLDHELEMRSELAVPLIGSDGRLEGVLNLESPAVDGFSEADSHLLQALATQAVIAIEQARLLDALQEIAALVPAQPYRHVLNRIFELAGTLLGQGAGVAWDQASPEPLLVAARLDSEWDQKVLKILNYYVALARQNAARQEALRAAQERQAVAETFAALGDIAANLLHHLNNKVGTIPVRVEGIQDKCAPALAANPYLAANLAEIERSATDAMQAVRESLSLLHPIHPRRLDLAACVAAAVAAARLPAGVAVRMEGLEGLPCVLAGQASLTLVIANLLSNAAEAMQGSGSVTISGTSGPAEVALSVSDTGPGVPQELQERIFELHFSGRKGPNTHKLGFGLWWVKTLMARLGGAVTVDSDGTHGATFVLKLPAAPADGGQS